MGDARPLPKPPRCRGVELSEGNYSGCAYGYGDFTAYTGPCDCPTCHGSGIEGVPFTLPHEEFGDPECCGCLVPMLIGDTADMRCNECGAIVRSVPVADIHRTIDEMELSLDVASEKCPHCGSVSLFPGFSRMLAFTCSECGRSVNRES